MVAALGSGDHVRINKNGQRHRHEWNAQGFPFVPTPPAQHMLETVDDFLVRLCIVGRKFGPAYPDSNLSAVVSELERLKAFCEKQ